MKRLTEEEKNLLLNIAREAILCQFQNQKISFPKTLPERLKANGASFVTLKKEGALRGCIGSLEAEKPLFLDVTINANLAAFSDPRFLPLSFSELPKISLEISVLTPSRPLVYKNKEELLKKLHPSLGVILEKDGSKATFLPQVWEELPEKTLFLEELALKAGLNKNDWQRAAFSVYEVEKFASKQGFLVLRA